MSGDGVAGGAFMTGFTVVPYGNVVFARPDYVENPLVAQHAVQRQPGQSVSRCWPPRAIPATRSPPTPLTTRTAA